MDSLYTKGLENKIDIVLYKGGVPSKDTQPETQVSLLPGGMMLSIQQLNPYGRIYAPNFLSSFVIA